MRGAALRAALQDLPPGVLRVKGVIDLDGEGAPHVCQFVPGSYTLAPASPAEAESPERFLVLIGEDIERAAAAFIRRAEAG